MEDDYTWVAVYRDGTVLREFDADGTDHGFAEVDMTRLRSFELRPRRIRLKPAVLRLGPDARPVFFRRRSLTINGENATPYVTDSSTVTVLGFQRTVGRRCVKAFVAFYSDGLILVSDKDEF